jgi:hypothetical protein
MMGNGMEMPEQFIVENELGEDMDEQEYEELQRALIE